MNFTYTMGDVLRKMRGANRFTSKDVSKKLDIKETTLIAYEQDKAIPPHMVIKQLAALYGITEGMLFWYAQDSLTPVDKSHAMYDHHQKVRGLMQSEVDLYETAIVNKLTKRDAKRYSEKEKAGIK